MAPIWRASGSSAAAPWAMAMRSAWDISGPVLVFSLGSNYQPQAPTPPAQAAAGQQQRSPSERPPRSIAIGGEAIRPGSDPHGRGAQRTPVSPYLQLVGASSVALLLLLPFPLVFWPLELAALAGWMLLGSRKEPHPAVVLHDGQAQRRSSPTGSRPWPTATASARHQPKCGHCLTGSHDDLDSAGRLPARTSRV